MTKRRTQPSVWNGLSGAAIAFLFAAVVGVAAAFATKDTFQAVSLAALGSLLVLAFEGKISEHLMPEDVAGLAEDLLKHPELRAPLKGIVDSYAIAHKEGVAEIVFDRAHHDLAALSQRWKKLSANHLESPFDDNRIRMMQTRRASHEMLAVACGDVDMRFLSHANGDHYREAQLDFVQRRGGRVRRIFVYDELNDAIKHSIEWHYDSGFEVWTADLMTLSRAGIEVPSIVVWDTMCASESKIPSWPAGPSVIDYYFNLSDIQRITDHWHSIKAHATLYEGTPLKFKTLSSRTFPWRGSRGAVAQTERLTANRVRSGGRAQLDN